MDTPSDSLQATDSNEPALLPENKIALPIRYGQTLASLLEKNAVPPGEIQRAAEALQKIFDPRRLRAGDTLHLALDSTGMLQELAYQPSPEITIKLERTPSGELTCRRDTLALSTEVVLLTGELETTLYEAILVSGEAPELLFAFTDIFQWDIDFFIDPQPGDRFRILFEKLFVQKLDGSKAFVRYGRILSASYEPKRPAWSNIEREVMAAFFFEEENGKAGYYDVGGNAFQKLFLKSPLNYRRISSYFSWGRRHPVLKKVRAHTGVDFSAPTGTPVVAAADGTIKEIGWKGGYGNCVVIAHKNHFITLYGHLSRFAEQLKEGIAVRQGQVIGYVGATGLSTGPHLHYTMYLNGKAINPLKIQPAAGEPIRAESISAFAAHRDALLLQMGMLPDTVHGPPIWITER